MPLKNNRSLPRRPVFSMPKPPEKPKGKWVILPYMWAGAKRMAMVLGFMVLLSSLISVYTLAALSPQGAAGLPENIVLVLPFDQDLADVPADAGFTGSFAPPPPSVYQIVESIEAAKDDPRVKGIVGIIGAGALPLAHTQEIRAALKLFRESGKFTHVYAPSYGEMGGGLGRYYMASSFENIWMQPMGVISIPGINAEVPYLRGLLDTLGVTPQFFQRHEYKTAYESMTNTEMSAENRQMLTEMVSNLRRVLVREIAADRGMEAGSFEALVGKGLFTGDAALKAGLIDKLDYEDVLADTVIEAATGQKADDVADDDLPFVDVAAYHADLENKRDTDKPKIALVYASGAIIQSEADGGQGGIAAADAIVPAIEDAMDDEAVKAIVLRVDSPGGSPTASESILRALDRAKGKGKPVIVSMGPTAASGGYWIASHADYIFAHPTTITGSIGVLGGKFDLRESWNILGINWNTIKWGENAGIWSMNTPFSESEAEQVNLMLDDVYDSFLARVSKGRKMEISAVDKIARGRVWTGEDAKRVGLVDELGGLNEALDFAAKKASLQNRSEALVEVFPKPLTPLEKLAKFFGGHETAVKALAAQARILETLAPATEALAPFTTGNPADYGVYEPLRLR